MCVNVFVKTLCSKIMFLRFMFTYDMYKGRVFISTLEYCSRWNYYDGLVLEYAKGDR